MKSSNNNAHDLLSDYFLRELDDQELEQLQEALKSDEVLREEFANIARDEWLLHHIHSDMDQQYVRESKTVIIKPKRRVFLSPAFVAIAASLSVAFLLFALFVNQEKQLTRNVVASTTTAVEQASIAVISSIFTLPGDSVVANNNGHLRNLEAHSELIEGDTITLPKSARLEFSYLGETTTVGLRNKSQFTVSTVNGAKNIYLEYGELTADVAKQSEGKPMRLTTVDAEAVVLGTRFELQAKDYTRLVVLSGQVGFNSLDAQQQLKVNAGFLAKSTQSSDWKTQAFIVQEEEPIYNHTLNKKKVDEFIAIDPERNYIGFLRFDCKELAGPILEARLRLHVERYVNDFGGRGTIRLFRVSPKSTIHDVLESEMVEVDSHHGRLGAGVDLEFDLSSESIQSGINTYVVKLDKGGDDFWFSSNKGNTPPRLTIKLEGAH